MRTYNILISILILIGFSGRCEATIYHSDGSAASVQALHNAALDGDTITLPTGTFSWTNRVTITKAITIQGQTTTDTVNGTANDQTNLVDNLVRVSGGQGYFNISRGARITGITFTGQGGLQTPMSNGAIRIGGNVPVRVDHCHFKHLNHSPMIAVWDANFGVADHNLFDDFVNENFTFLIEMADYGGADNGDGAFADVAGYGGPTFWFIEDNYISYTHWNGGGGGGVDAFHGGKYVFRYNKVFNATTLGHSTGMTWPRGRGVRAQEVYNNEWHMDANGTIDGTTGGSALYHDNSFYGVLQYGIGLQVYRAIWSFGSPFYGADGSSPWDVNDAHGLYESGTATSGTNTSITDTSKNWATNHWAGYSVKRPSDGAAALITGNSNNTLQVASWQNENWATGNRYEIRQVLIILDQPGRGSGDLIDVQNPAWPNQELEPCYSWNNIHYPAGEHLNFSRRTGAQTILQGRDYFNDTPMPDYTPYTYPHPLTKSQLPRELKASSPQQPSKKRQKWGKAKKSGTTKWLNRNQ
jgi:hypothetical protein